MKKMLPSVAIILGFYLLICLALFVFQKSIIYYKTPSMKPLAGESIAFSVNEQKLNSVVVNRGKKRAVIYFGGNAEQLESTAFEFAGKITEQTVYLVNYRGYGGSSGSPNEKGILKDALAVFYEISREHRSVIMMGRSLGSGVATYVASKREVEKVVLITPYDSLKNVAGDIYKIFPTSILATERYESKSFAKNIECPTLIVYSGEDEVISNKRTEYLIEAFAPKKLTVKKINSATHNDISGYREYWTAILDFLI